VDAIESALIDQLPNLPAWGAPEWQAVVDEEKCHISELPAARFLRENNVALVVDGTEIRIGRPDAEHQAERYSYKKHQHSLNILIVATLSGRILWHSEPYDDVPNDQGQWKRNKFRKCVFWC
jgi:hypothetical protein